MKSLRTQASLGNALNDSFFSRAVPAKVVSACANSCATGNTVMLTVVAPASSLEMSSSALNSWFMAESASSMRLII